MNDCDVSTSRENRCQKEVYWREDDDSDSSVSCTLLNALNLIHQMQLFITLRKQ